MRSSIVILLLIVSAAAHAASSCRTLFHASDSFGDLTNDPISVIWRAEISRASLRDRLFQLRVHREAGELPAASLAALDQQLAAVKLEFGAALIRDTFLMTAYERDAVLIIRPLKAASVACLERSTAPKPLNLKIKTAPEGPIAGYVPVDPRLTMSHLSAQELAPLIADVQAGLRDRRYTRLKVGEHEVLGDSRGHPFSSDVDLAVILYRGEGASTTARFTNKQGWLSPRDEGVIARINELFDHIDPREFARELVQHGPWNAQPEASLPDFPLTAFLPNGGVRVLETPASYHQFIGEMKARGYAN